MKFPFDASLLPPHFPLAKLPRKIQKKHFQNFIYCMTLGGMKCSDDDHLIRAIATRLGVPGMEAIPIPDASAGGGGNVILTCDGTWSYCIGCFSGFEDPMKNGYEMIAIKTDALKGLAADGLPAPDYRRVLAVLCSLLYFMGFDGEKQIKTLRTLDFG